SSAFLSLSARSAERAETLSSSPRKRRAVRGKLRIGEGKLVRVGSTGCRWVWRFVDGGDRDALGDTVTHEIGEANGRQRRATGRGCDAQEQIGDHGGVNLQADGVF